MPSKDNTDAHSIQTDSPFEKGCIFQIHALFFIRIWPHIGSGFWKVKHFIGGIKSILQNTEEVLNSQLNRFKAEYLCKLLLLGWTAA